VCAQTPIPPAQAIRKRSPSVVSATPAPAHPGTFTARPRLISATVRWSPFTHDQACALPLAHSHALHPLGARGQPTKGKGRPRGGPSSNMRRRRFRGQRTLEHHWTRSLGSPMSSLPSDNSVEARQAKGGQRCKCGSARRRTTPARAARSPHPERNSFERADGRVYRVKRGRFGDPLLLRLGSAVPAELQPLTYLRDQGAGHDATLRLSHLATPRPADRPPRLPPACS
jgi:hypothetical protein